MTQSQLLMMIRTHYIAPRATARDIPPLLQHLREGDHMWSCPCGRTGDKQYLHVTEICPVALVKALVQLDAGPPTLSLDEISIGLSNLGHDTSCGACMSIFFTGVSLETHTCPGEHAQVVVTVE